MTVSTVNRRKTMPTCCLRHTISNETLEWRFRVHVNVILNIQTEHENVYVSSKVVTCSSMFSSSSKILQNFQALSESKRYESATMHVKNSGWSMSNLQDLPKKRNPTSTQHSFLFSSSEDVKLSFQRQSFCQFEADENNRKCG